MDIFDFDRRNPDLRVNSLAELCSFPGVNFVRCAFVTMLGRSADPTGAAYYVEQLRTGVSKLTVINNLRQSAEGREYDPGIEGLDKALKKHRSANHRLFGPIVRWFTGREGDSVVERRLRSVIYELEIERNLSAMRAATANHYLVVLDGKVDHVRKELRTALASQSITPRHIAHAEAAGDSEWENALNSVLNG